VLTVDFERLGLGPGMRVLDIGCGGGRHAFEAFRRGADVVALDHDRGELEGVEGMLHAMAEAGEVPAGTTARTLHGDALHLPFDEGAFDRVIAAEVLEHIPDDERAIGELARILRPGGVVAVTVPRWFPERICWALSDAYHEVDGGHVRIYTRHALLERLRAAGLTPLEWHHAHALHSPYWWLKCLTRPDEDGRLASAYHRLLEWDIVRGPLVTRLTERILNPLLGKSLVVYARKTAGRQLRAVA
jgi:SAM-dependent methyltransferase